MSSNTQFSMAVHVLSALAYNEGELMGSEALAESVGTNPSFLRGLIGRLREAGLVETQMGKGGGTRLARSPSAISLHDIYESVEARASFKTHCCPDSKGCPVQSNMTRLLDELNERVERAIESELDKTSLADLLLRLVADKKISGARAKKSAG